MERGDPEATGISSISAGLHGPWSCSLSWQKQRMLSSLLGTPSRADDAGNLLPAGLEQGNRNRHGWECLRVGGQIPAGGRLGAPDETPGRQTPTPVYHPLPCVHFPATL